MTDARAETEVLIVGAGPTGLTLACELARRRVAVRLIDGAASPFVGSRGKGLQPRTLEVFEDLGVLEQVLAAGGLYPRLRATWRRFVLGHWSLHTHRAPTPDVPYPNTWMLPQWETEAILRARLEALGGQVEWGIALAGFAQDDDGVTATVTGPGGGEASLRARWLVGTDGGRSTVRKALGVAFEGAAFQDERMIVGDVEVEGLGREHWHVWPLAKGGPIALCPLPGTDRFQLTVKLAPEAVAPELTLEAIQAHVAAATRWRPDIRLRAATWLSLYRPQVRLVDRSRVGRLFLAGDAAHVHPPDGGQGLNTGVQDAYNLGWKLALTVAGAPDALLDTYAAERLPIAAGVLGLSAKLHTSRSRPKRGKETQQLGLGYRGGPLAREERASPGKIQAGDRAPDAPCADAAGTPVRLFERFRGTHFTLLAFGRADLDALARSVGEGVRVLGVVAPGAPAVEGASTLIDTGGHARRAYDVAGDALVLVRPDGYIGWAGGAEATAGLTRYLAQFMPAPGAAAHSRGSSGYAISIGPSRHVA